MPKPWFTVGREPIFLTLIISTGFSTVFGRTLSKKKEEPWLVSPLSKLVPLPNDLINGL